MAIASTAPLGRPVRPSREARPGGKNGPRAAYPLCDGVCLALGRARTPCSPLGGDPQLIEIAIARPGRPLSYGARRGRVPLFARRRVDASGRLLPRRGGRGTSLLRLLEPRRRRADGRDGRLQDVPVGDNQRLVPERGNRVLLDHDRGVRHDRVLLRRDGVRAAEGLRRRVGQVVVQRRQYGVRRRNDHGSDGGRRLDPESEPHAGPGHGRVRHRPDAVSGRVRRRSVRREQLRKLRVPLPRRPERDRAGLLQRSVHLRVLGPAALALQRRPQRPDAGAVRRSAVGHAELRPVLPLLQLARKRHGVVPERELPDGLRGRRGLLQRRVHPRDERSFELRRLRRHLRGRHGVLQRRVRVAVHGRRDVLRGRVHQYADRQQQLRRVRHPVHARRLVLLVG